MATAKSDEVAYELTEEKDGSYTVAEPGAARAEDDDDLDDGEATDEAAPAAATDEDEQEDAGVKKGGAEEENEDETDDPQAAKRNRRREERRNKKLAQRQQVDTLRSELAVRDGIISNMADRLNAIEQRGTQTDLVQLDAEIKKATDAAGYYKSVIAEATKKQDGAASADATEKLLLCMQRSQQLTAVRQQAVTVTSQREATPLNPAVVAHGEAWLKRNKWYNPQGKDQDSQLVRTLDASLMNEGMSPATPAYWEELDRRVQRYGLRKPSNKGYTGGGQSSNSDDGKPVTRSPVAGGGGRSSGAASSSGTYKLSAERVKALKDAGMWENPKERADAIRHFRDYDRNNSR